MLRGRSVSPLLCIAYLIAVIVGHSVFAVEYSSEEVRARGSSKFVEHDGDRALSAVKSDAADHSSPLPWWRVVTTYGLRDLTNVASRVRRLALDGNSSGPSIPSVLPSSTSTTSLTPTLDPSTPRPSPAPSYVPTYRPSPVPSSTAAPTSNCDVGEEYDHKISSCVGCAPGRAKGENRAGPCSDCPKGKFQNETGQVSCLECEPGRYQNANGSSTCEVCPAGSFTVTPATVHCALCEVGKFLNNTGSANLHDEEEDCRECPTGVPSAPDRVSCRVCQTGEVYNRIHNGTEASCEFCKAGKYSVSPHREECKEECDAGELIYEDLECRVCPEGRYAPMAQENECLECQAGFYTTGSDSRGATRCESCTAGKFSNTLSVECTDCPEGKYSGSSAPKCEDCIRGTYAEEKGKSTCERCEAGKFASSKSSSFCEPCLNGTYSSTSGSSKCVECTKGKYQPKKGKDTCESCMPGKISSHANATTCENCPVGRFMDKSGQHECQNCDPGKYSSRNSSDSCERCDEGKFTASEEATACESCPPGEFAKTTGSTECEKCQPGFYSSSPESSGCSICQAPLFSSERSRNCPMCKAGYYSYPSGSDSVSCMACPNAAECKSGRGVTSIDVMKGHYRFSQNSTAIYSCPMAANCGGGNSSSTCVDGSSGPLCSLCDNGFYSNGVFCEPCDEARKGLFWTTVILGSVFLLVMGYGIAFLLGLTSAEKSLQELQNFLVKHEERIMEVQERVTAVIITMQIILIVQDSHIAVGGAEFPSPYFGFLKSLDILTFDFVGVMPAGCISGPVGHREFLFLYTLLPVALLGVSLVVMVLVVRSPQTRLMVLQNAVALCLLFLPVIARRVCQTFRCTAFDADGDGSDDRFFLTVDYAIDCESEEYDELYSYSLIAVLVYPVGVPLALLFCLSLYRQRLNPPGRPEHQVVQERREDEVLQSSPVAYLATGLRPSCWYYGVVVTLGRRLLLTCAVLSCQNLSQLIMFILVVAIISTVLEREVHPYNNEYLGAFVYLLHWQVVFCVIAMLVLDSGIMQDVGTEAIAITLLTTNILLFVIVFTDVHMTVQREKASIAAGTARRWLRQAAISSRKFFNNTDAESNNGSVESGALELWEIGSVSSQTSEFCLENPFHSELRKTGDSGLFDGDSDFEHYPGSHCEGKGDEFAGLESVGQHNEAFGTTNPMSESSAFARQPYSARTVSLQARLATSLSEIRGLREVEMVEHARPSSTSKDSDVDLESAGMSRLRQQWATLRAADMRRHDLSRSTTRRAPGRLGSQQSIKRLSQQYRNRMVLTDAQSGSNEEDVEFASYRTVVGSLVLGEDADSPPASPVRLSASDDSDADLESAGMSRLRQQWATLRAADMRRHDSSRSTTRRAPGRLGSQQSIKRLSQQYRNRMVLTDAQPGSNEEDVEFAPWTGFGAHKAAAAAGQEELEVALEMAVPQAHAHSPEGIQEVETEWTISPMSPLASDYSVHPPSADDGLSKNTRATPKPVPSTAQRSPASTVGLKRMPTQ